MNAGSLRSQLSPDSIFELVDHCPAAVALFDREMNYLAVSRRFLKDYGLVESPVGRNHYALYPDLPEAWRRAHQRGLAGEVVTSDATEPFRRSPTQLDWVNWEVRPWHTADGAIGGIILFSEVVTATRDAQARDNAVFDQASVGVMRVETRTGTILDVNERFARSLGYSPVELIGWSWMSITHPDDLGNVGAVNTAMARSDSYQTEKRYLCKDGTPWWAHVTVNPIAMPGAAAQEQVAFIVDINARKRAEAAEAAANARFRTVFTAASVGMAQVDATTGLFLDVNASFANILGCTPEELVGQAFTFVSGANDLDADTARYADLSRNPRAYTRERSQVRRDGTRVWVEVNVTPLWEPGVAPTAYLIVAKDISKRKAAQDAVERSERRFRALIERASDMLIELDAKGRVSFWSPAAAEQLGFTSAEMLGRTMVSLIREDDVERAQQALTDLYRTPGATARLSWRQETRDGVPLTLAVTARNLLDDPDVGSLVINLRDQTDEARLSAQLQQAQKLEGLGRLAGGVAHDFNNLLTVVLICARAIQQALPKEDPSADDIAQVLAAAERATGLTRQLLAFARKQAIDPMPLDVNDVVNGTRRMLERLLGEDIRLVADLAPDMGPVFADTGQLEQVLVNLAVNARDAMPRGGRLTISTRNVNDRWVKISVSDTGTGMPAEVRAHLFEPFFTTKPVGQGTGLGLATVYGIVTQAGGQIRVDSEVGRGTTFELDFPRSSRSAQPNVELTERALRGSETVVVVEDELQVRNVIVRVLRGAGYKVLPAEGAQEALALIERTPNVGLVLTDVVMPEHDGRWLVQELQRRKVTLPVLFISGYIDDMVSMHGMVDGVELLPKPFTPSSLQERVRRVLDQAAS